MIINTVLAVFAASMFVFNFVVGAVLTATTGIPGASGLVTGIVTGIFMSLSVLWVPKWWTGAVVFGLYCFFAWVTPLMGPPGPWKIIVGLIAGVGFSSVFCGLGTIPLLAAKVRTRLSISWLVFVLLLIAGVTVMFELLNLPGKEKFMGAVFVFAGVFLILGLFGVYFGWKLDENYLINTTTRKRVKAALQ